MRLIDPFEFVGPASLDEITGMFSQTIQLKELNDGTFGIPEAHTYIHHPDYFEAKKDVEQWVGQFGRSLDTRLTVK